MNDAHLRTPEMIALAMSQTVLFTLDTLQRFLSNYPELETRVAMRGKERAPANIYAQVEELLKLAVWLHHDLGRVVFHKDEDSNKAFDQPHHGHDDGT